MLVTHYLSFYTSDALSSVVRLKRCAMKDSASSSRRILRLVPVFVLETHNQTKTNVCPSSSRQIKCVSSIKMSNELVFSSNRLQCVVMANDPFSDARLIFFGVEKFN